MGTAFLYGNGGSGGTGATLTVTAPAGCTVTISKDGKTKTKTAGADGTAVFKGLETGTWSVTITDGGQQASKNVTVTADYATEITFFSATIHVTYPAGSTCTATDGVTTLAAPDTSGTWACVVPNAGTWTVSSNIKSENVTIGDGDNVHLDLSKIYIVKDGVVQSGYAFSNNLRNGTALTVTSQTGSLKFNTNDNVSNGRATDKIDLTKFKVMVADFTTTGCYADSGVGVYRGLNASSFSGVVSNKLAGRGDSGSVDISGINGSYYIGVTANSSDNTAVVYLKNLYLGG